MEDNINQERKCLYSYNLSGELIGMQDVQDWPPEEVSRLIVAIQSREDGSWASMKLIKSENEARIRKNEAG